MDRAVYVSHYTACSVKVYHSFINKSVILFSDFIKYCGSFSFIAINTNNSVIKLLECFIYTMVVYGVFDMSNWSKRIGNRGLESTHTHAK